MVLGFGFIKHIIQRITRPITNPDFIAHICIPDIPNTKNQPPQQIHNEAKSGTHSTPSAQKEKSGKEKATFTADKSLHKWYILTTSNHQWVIQHRFHLVSQYAETWYKMSQVSRDWLWMNHLAPVVQSLRFKIRKSGELRALVSSGLPLTSLDLYHSDADLVQLQKLPSLTSLSFRNCRNLTDADLAHLQNLPLTRLDLYDCDNLTDAGLAHLQNLPLETLDLSRCDNLTDAGLVHLQRLPLGTLNLSLCRNFTDAGLAHLQNLPLTSLNLSLCRNFTYDGLAHLQNLPLEILDLSYCDNLTDAALAHLQNLPSMNLYI